MQQAYRRHKEVMGLSSTSQTSFKVIPRGLGPGFVKQMRTGMEVKQHLPRRRRALRANDTTHGQGNRNTPNYEPNMRCHGGDQGQYLSAYEDPKIQKRDANHPGRIAYRFDRLNDQEVNHPIRR